MPLLCFHDTLNVVNGGTHSCATAARVGALICTFCLSSFPARQPMSIFKSRCSDVLLAADGLSQKMGEKLVNAIAEQSTVKDMTHRLEIAVRIVVRREPMQLLVDGVCQWSHASWRLYDRQWNDAIPLHQVLRIALSALKREVRRRENRCKKERERAAEAVSKLCGLIVQNNHVIDRFDNVVADFPLSTRFFRDPYVVRQLATVHPAFSAYDMAPSLGRLELSKQGLDCPPLVPLRSIKSSRVQMLTEELDFDEGYHTHTASRFNGGTLEHPQHILYGGARIPIFDVLYLRALLHDGERTVSKSFHELVKEVCKNRRVMFFNSPPHMKIENRVIPGHKTPCLAIARYMRTVRKLAFPRLIAYDHFDNIFWQSSLTRYLLQHFAQCNSMFSLQFAKTDSATVTTRISTENGCKEIVSCRNLVWRDVVEFFTLQCGIPASSNKIVVTRTSNLRSVVSSLLGADCIKFSVDCQATSTTVCIPITDGIDIAESGRDCDDALTKFLVNNLPRLASLRLALISAQSALQTLKKSELLVSVWSDGSWTFGSDSESHELFSAKNSLVGKLPASIPEARLKVLRSFPVSNHVPKKSTSGRSILLLHKDEQDFDLPTTANVSPQNPRRARRSVQIVPLFTQLKKQLSSAAKADVELRVSRLCGFQLVLCRGGRSNVVWTSPFVSGTCPIQWALTAYLSVTVAISSQPDADFLLVEVWRTNTIARLDELSPSQKGKHLVPFLAGEHHDFKEINDALTLKFSAESFPVAIPRPHVSAGDVWSDLYHATMFATQQQHLRSLVRPQAAHSLIHFFKHE